MAELGELLDQVAAGVIWFDGEGRVVWVNQGAHALLKLSAFIDPETELDRAVTIRDERGRSVAELADASARGGPRGTWMPAVVTLADGSTLAGRIRITRRLHVPGVRGDGDAIVVTVWGPDAVGAGGSPGGADQAEQTRRVLRRLGITDREADVAMLLLQGFRVGTIAVELHHSPHTIRNRLKRLFQKTGTANQPELVAALRSHLEEAVRTGGDATAAG